MVLQSQARAHPPSIASAAVRTAILQYGWKVLGIEDSTAGLLDVDYRGPHGNMWLTLDSVDEIISKGGTILGSSNKSHPFRFAVKQPDGKMAEIDVSGERLAPFPAHKHTSFLMVILGSCRPSSGEL